MSYAKPKYESTIDNDSQTVIDSKPAQEIPVAGVTQGTELAIVMATQVEILPFKFDNISDDDLLELYGDLDESSKTLSKWLETAKGVIKARMGDPGDTGITQYSSHFKFDLKNQTQMRLDTEGVKSEMSAEWYEAHCKSIPMQVLRVSRRKDV